MWIVQNIGGSRIQVTGIVPEGTNSHTFEPAPSDAAVMADADIVFVNGLHLEEPTRELADANVRDGVPVISLGEMTIAPDRYIYDFSFPESGGDPNPHLWTNPLYALTYAEIVKDELSKVDPEGAATYAKNLAAFKGRIDQLGVQATSPPPEWRSPEKCAASIAASASVRTSGAAPAPGTTTSSG